MFFYSALLCFQGTSAIYLIVFCATELTSGFITCFTRGQKIVLPWYNCIATVSFLIATGSKTTCAVIENLTQLFQGPPRNSCCYSKPGSGQYPTRVATVVKCFSKRLRINWIKLELIPVRIVFG